MGFWDEPQGAAVFKHAVLREYAPIFAGKVGSRSEANRVEIVDGYAGQGWYDNGDPGSPAVLLDTAETLGAIRNVHCTFIEGDPSTFSKLKARLAEMGVGEDRATLRHGSMSEHLDEVLERAAGVPLFAFVDPYGLGLPFDELVGKLMGRPPDSAGRRVPTEVLVNFTYSGIYRSVGYVTPNTSNPTQLKYAARRTEQLNSNLNGDWWQDVARTSTGDELVATIRQGYIQRVRHAAGPDWQCLEVPVSDTTTAKPIYDLLLFTQHPQGRWFFNDAVSLGRQVFATFCADGFMQAPLWEPQEDWVNDIERNLRRLLSTGSPVRVVERMLEVYGTTLGEARGKHVKKAAQRLVANGIAAGDVHKAPHQLVLQTAPTLGPASSHNVA
ncbi:MAG: three-Cys-motif partner protein TcmP [Actinomycetota bacterium]|nr:three-Cys-motif partner protein TcmP [Actinomycetota bacterium]